MDVPNALHKLCISGTSHTDHCGVEALDLGKALGREVVLHDGVVMAAASGGFPAWAALGAREAGGYAVGFSPARSEEEHTHEYRLPTDNFNTIVYTGLGPAGVHLMLARAADAILVGCGKLSVIHEFAIAYEEGKPIGILEGPWRTDEMLRDIIKTSDLATDEIAVSKDPTELVERVLTIMGKKAPAEPRSV